MKLTLNKIKNYNLIHIYCKLNEFTLKQLFTGISKTLFFHIKHKGITSQFISKSYKKGLYQVAYTGGRNALFLIKLFNYDKSKLISIIKNDLCNMFINLYKHLNLKYNENRIKYLIDNLNINKNTMYLKYFENAVYQWTGNYGFNLIKEHKIAKFIN